MFIEKTSSPRKRYRPGRSLRPVRLMGFSTIQQPYMYAINYREALEKTAKTLNIYLTFFVKAS